MKPFDTVAYQKIRLVMEGKNDKSDNFEMDILYEDALDKFLGVLKNFRRVGNLEDNL